ncbi:hypothetical protein [Aureimonas sp. AU20]|uniref:hypothetical protein n=1 Tax=Aureimonas sp. AU20 TaxID=1349819 RepID=UPI000B079C7B|nr:hypothetical protein [Aureimonas sp. AU20]
MRQDLDIEITAGMMARLIEALEESGFIGEDGTGSVPPTLAFELLDRALNNPCSGGVRAQSAEREALSFLEFHRTRQIARL